MAQQPNTERINSFVGVGWKESRLLIQPTSNRKAEASAKSFWSEGKERGFCVFQTTDNRSEEKTEGRAYTISDCSAWRGSPLHPKPRWIKGFPSGAF